MLQSPYRVKKNTQFKEIITPIQSISPNRLTKLLKTGQLTERSETIIQFLYELNYLSGYLIQNCFHHPQIIPELRKLRNDKKNPYLSELQYLIGTGIIKQYAFYDSFNNVLSYVYGLTEGAHTWARERFYRIGLFQSLKREYEPIVRQRPYEEMLSILSLNQFYISATITNTSLLESSIIYPERGPMATFRFKSQLIRAGSFRRPAFIKADFIDYICQLTGYLQIDTPDFIILVVESMDAASELQHMIQSSKISVKELCMYVVDNSSMGMKNPLIEALGHFNSDDQSTYDLCSIIT